MTEANLELTATIVTAYISNNAIRAGDYAALITEVHAALTRLSEPSGPSGTVLNGQHATATPNEIRKSITREHLFSFEDGLPYKTLKRHLTSRGLTPEVYREKWGLPSDYPMVAAGYTERRSALALSIGLGQKRRV